MKTPISWLLGSRLIRVYSVFHCAMKLGIVYTNWRSFYSFSIGKEPIFGHASGLRNSDIVIIGQLRKYGISYFLKQEVHERELLVCILPQYTSLDSILPKRNTRVVQGGSEVEKKKIKNTCTEQLNKINIPKLGFWL